MLDNVLDKVKVYKIWAGDNALWTAWAKPVPFIHMQKTFPEDLSIPNLDWISRPDFSTAIIVDLPGGDGVLEGLALARMGYRPVPLYNGVSCRDADRMVVPAQDIEKALYNGAAELQRLNLSPAAPPAFLLDSNRMSGTAKPGRYDNRWSIFPQDMPSAAYLLGKGIDSVVVRTKKRNDAENGLQWSQLPKVFSSEPIQSDLEYILYRYQSAGITVYMYDGEEPVKVSKPSKLKSLLYRFSVTLGLRRNPAGGFGGTVPEPSRGG